MIPEDKKSPLKFCKLHVFIFSPLLRKVDWLIDWLKGLRWIMIPEDKKIPLIWDFANLVL